MKTPYPRRLNLPRCPIVRTTFLGLGILAFASSRLPAQEASPSGSAAESCRILTDERLEQPLGVIAREYARRTASRVTLSSLSPADVIARVKAKETEADVVLCLATEPDDRAAVGDLAGARKVAWKYPSMQPVWAAALTEHPDAAPFVRFLGGPTGHRLWSESEAGFTIIADTSAQAYEWVAEHRTKRTYPMTAMRMLGELGGMREGICIDIGCGPGHLELELAKRSRFKIIGLDIDPDCQPLFEKRIRAAGLEDRVSFVVGDAQKLPFPDDYADVVVSRGTLIFIPDIPQCLREVHRVLKPTGVAFLGGRYLYAPQAHKIPTEKLKALVEEAGVPGAAVVDARGQWVKIVGPDAPESARGFQGGPQMLAGRMVADYGITEGKCLLVCRGDGDLEQSLQRGLTRVTDLSITALYPSDEVANGAQKRLQAANTASRIECRVGHIGALPFDAESFDLVAGVGPVLIWEKDRQQAMREVYRVLRPGGAALLGGRYLGMPDFRKVSSESLREDAAKTGIPSIRVYDDMGQWVEVLKGVEGRRP